MKAVYYIVLTVALFLGVASVDAQILDGPPGRHLGTEVNHEEGYLSVASGTGDAPTWAKNGAMVYAWALDRGRIRAMKNLAEQLDAVYITSENTIRDVKEGESLITKNVKVAVETIVLWAEDLEWKQDGDQNWVVKLGIPQDGPQGMAEALRPVAVLIEEERKGEQPENYQTPDLESAKDDRTFMNTNYTGVVINVDKREPVKLVQFPRILSTNHRVVYSVLDAEYASSYGAVGYGKRDDNGTLSPQRLHDRIGDNPLVVEAVRVKNGGDMMVSIADAAKIAYIDQTSDVLKECRVAFVVGLLPQLEE
jgi:hypothetical protein